MDFGKAFTYAFEDPDWVQKGLIIALISLIPVVGQLVVFGWMIEIARRVIRREAVVFPELNFGDQLITGLKGWVVTFLYSLPAVLVIIPIAIIAPLFENNRVETIIGLLFACLAIIMVLYGILITLITPAALGTLAAKGGIGDGLRVNKVIKLFLANPGAYLLVILGMIIVGFIAPLGTLLCVVGVAVTSVYGSAVTGHLYGQAYLAANPSDN